MLHLLRLLGLLLLNRHVCRLQSAVKEFHWRNEISLDGKVEELIHKYSVDISQLI